MECRQRIISAAARFFSQFGIKAVTMDFLAEQLGISKRTIYEIFKDKDTLISESIQLSVLRHQIENKEIIENSTNVIEAIYRISLKNCRMYETINPLCFLDLKRYHPQIYNSVFKKGDLKDSMNTCYLLEKGIKQGVFNKNLNVGIVNTAWQELLSLMHDPDKFQTRFLDMDELSENIMYPFIRGLCTVKGLKFLEKYFVESKSTIPSHTA